MFVKMFVSALHNLTPRVFQKLRKVIGRIAESSFAEVWKQYMLNAIQCTNLSLHHFKMKMGQKSNTHRHLSPIQIRAIDLSWSEGGTRKANTVGLEENKKKLGRQASQHVGVRTQ